MIKNYFKIAWRNITKHRFYSVVNVLGLFAGISFALLIGAYIWSELQVNKQLRNHNRQYILTTVSTDPNVGYELATFGPLAKRLKEDYPGLVANYFRYDGITSVVSKGDKHFREGLQVGDSTLLKMFGFEVLAGDVQTALNKPFSVVITDDKAIKYFGKTDVVGESISIQSFSGGNHDFVVTAVLKPMGKNSIADLVDDYPNTFFIPMNTLSYFNRTDVESWQNLFIASYIELKKGVTVKDLERPIQQLLQQSISDELKKVVKVKPVLLSEYYLQQDKGLVKRMLYTLFLTGLFILLMAVVNFINIAISRAGSRIKEIGIRKVLGSMKRQLVLQFLAESIILVFVATVLALAFYSYLRPLFGQIIGKPIPALTIFPLYFILIPLALTLVVGTVAGIYPAFVLSAMKSVDSLKGKLKTAGDKILLRKSLVGFQFSVALMVLSGAVIVTKQISYFFNQNLGYNKEYIVSAQVPRDWSTAGVKRMQAIRDQFATLPQVNKVALSFEIPNGANGGQVAVYKNGKDSTNAIFAQVLDTDENYLSAYQIPLKAGSFFEGTATDSGTVVINEKAVATLGYKNAADAIGQALRRPGDPTGFTIKGVAKDFHFGSMQQEIPAIVFFNVRYSPNYRFLSFKIKPGNVQDAIQAIQKKWAELLPGSSFEYNFMDESLRKMYTSELRLKKASYAATVLSVIIVLLGVLGLVALSVQRRTKEIGIRKVLGASVSGIISLFIKDFLWVMLAGAAIACPLAYWMMHSWLNNYAYRISLTATPFIISIGGLALVTALLIAMQALKVGTDNPVKSLRTE